MPEVLIGVIPGGGGTQRLPRLVGPAAALDMITTGRHVPAEEAHELGIIDAIVEEGDLKAAAIQFAKEKAGVKPLPRVRDRDERLSEATPELFAATRKKIARRARGQPAMELAIQAVEAAVAKPFDEGVQIERQFFDQVETSDEAGALRYAFFSEREIARLPGLPKDLATPEVKSMAVVGAGTMGGGIAMSYADAGFPVKLMDATPEGLENGMARIRANYQKSVDRGSLAQEEMDARLERIEPVAGYDDIGDCDAVTEAAFERMPVKKEIFTELDRVMKPGALLFTNTSALNIDEIAAVTSRPEVVAGTHFFVPANVMKLFEVVHAREDVSRDAGGGHETRARNQQDLRVRGQLRRICREPEPGAVQYRTRPHDRRRRAAGAGR